MRREREQELNQRTLASFEIALDALEPPAEHALEQSDLLFGILTLLVGGKLAQVGVYGASESREMGRVNGRQRVQQGVRRLRGRLCRAHLRRRTRRGRHALLARRLCARGQRSTLDRDEDATTAKSTSSNRNKLGPLCFLALLAVHSDSVRVQPGTTESETKQRNADKFCMLTSGNSVTATLIGRFPAAYQAVKEPLICCGILCPGSVSCERVSWVKIHASCSRCDVCASRSIYTHPRGDQKASVEAKALDRRTGTGIASVVE